MAIERTFLMAIDIEHFDVTCDTIAGIKRWTLRAKRPLARSIVESLSNTVQIKGKYEIRDFTRVWWVPRSWVTYADITGNITVTWTIDETI